MGQGTDGSGSSPVPPIFVQKYIKIKNTKKFGSNKIITYLCSEKKEKVCQQYLLCSDTGSGFMEMSIRLFTFI